MPRFYFDTDDGERRFHDETGVDLASFQDVPDEAMGLLRDLTHVHLLVGRREVMVEVRDAEGKTAYRATMTVVGEIIE